MINKPHRKRRKSSKQRIHLSFREKGQNIVGVVLHGYAHHGIVGIIKWDWVKIGAHFLALLWTLIFVVAERDIDANSNILGPP